MPLVGTLLTNRETIALPPSATALEAAQTMAREKVGAVLVMEGEEAKGIFTERDLMVRVLVAGKSADETPLEAVMTSDLFTAHPGRKAAEIRQEMAQRHIRHCPVVQEGRVLGMISLRDILRADLADKEHEVEAITAYIQGVEPDENESEGEA